MQNVMSIFNLMRSMKIVLMGLRPPWNIITNYLGFAGEIQKRIFELKLYVACLVNVVNEYAAECSIWRRMRELRLYEGT
jgi:hypothetical protein